jgi:hypothetical protein
MRDKKQKQIIIIFVSLLFVPVTYKHKSQE